MAEAPASPLGGGSHESGGEQSPQSGGVREQDRYLPIANISRIMKKALPNNGKIAKLFAIGHPCCHIVRHFSHLVS